ncbi:tumor necrosis factor receptor superfamily member 26 isoform X2 [Triplophysa rosa]|uniref:tumor necrosis factor receptor superfamily member 26 isoform X2 n=1 Tax=Triplophysa rosa TaxID=992332 RepID=UPI002545EFC8|nr:tumor necrosis factor receptor superfamily member 26 isoform X2 [Triplophysa rosa]
MLVTVLLIASGILTGHLMYGLPKQSKARYPRDCPNMCPPGQCLLPCRCTPCRSGFYTSEENREDSCHRCFQTCKPEFNMEVVEECKSTSDVKCRCQDGFTCTEHDQYTGHCKQCDPITSPTPSLVYTSRVYTSTATTLFPRTQKPSNWSGENGVLVWIIFGFMLTMLSIIIVTVLFRICRKKEKECFKQFVRRCSLGNLEVDSETTLPTNSQSYAQEMPSHESTPTNKKTDCSFHQPTVSDQAVPPSGNLENGNRTK